MGLPRLVTLGRAHLPAKFCFLARPQALAGLLYLGAALGVHQLSLERDNSGSDVEWQTIKYASYCSCFSYDEIYKHFAEYLGTEGDDAQVKI